MRITQLRRFNFSEICFEINKQNNKAIENNVNQQFVPNHKPVPEKYIKSFEDFLKDKPKILVLTGAGISTESGIPDYRSEGVGMYARTNSRPVQHMDFLQSHQVRKRYWARNFIAWPRFSGFQPNDTHLKLAQMEKSGQILGLVTQNVDQLHKKAGSSDKNMIELHGNGYSVICVGKSSDEQFSGKNLKKCNYHIKRMDLQLILAKQNAHININNIKNEGIRPDGDVDISQEFIDQFQTPICPQCGGNLKPDIVFFGDNIPRNRIDDVNRLVEASDGLLVLGSSLLVFSGYRICLNTHELGLPIAIVNIGPTRADHLATMKLSAKCGDVIPKLFSK